MEGREALLTAQVPELCRRAGAGSNGGGRGPRNPARAVAQGHVGRISKGTEWKSLKKVPSRFKNREKTKRHLNKFRFYAIIFDITAL